MASAKDLSSIDMAHSFSDSSTKRSRSSGKVAANASLCQPVVLASAAASNLSSTSRR